MVFDYSINTSSRTVYCQLKGRIGSADLVAATDEVFGDPRWERHYDMIWDAREAKLALSPPDLAGLYDRAARHATEGFTGRIAAVLSGTIALGVGRLVELQGDRHRRQIRVFRTVEEGAEWLGIPEDARTWRENEANVGL